VTSAPLLQFTAAGSVKSVASDIEQCARVDNVLSAIVVPWESTPTLLSIAVTLVKIDGWAIEHTNLGTITVADLGNASARVAVLAVDTATDPDQEKRLTMLARFAGQIQHRLQIVTSDDEPAGR
jgi:hypothetical protein